MQARTVALWPLFVSVVLGASSDRPNRCIIPSSNGTADDSPAVVQAFCQCASNSVIEFQQGVDYYTNTPISATNLSNVAIQMNGNIHLPRNITAIQEIVNGSSGSTYATGKYWFSLAGSNIDYTGSSDVNNGWIISYGQEWWDANSPNGTGIDNRPHLMQFNAQNSTLNYFKSRKPIAWGVQLKGKNISVSHAFVDAESTTGSFPFNTDAFDVTGRNIRITDSVIYNGDDAIAVQSGSHNIYFGRNTIGYQTHGMSIGSLGQDPNDFANVSNVRFDNVTAINALYGARFKSWIGGQGLVKNVTWSNIRVYNVTFPIYVTQTYMNQGSSQTQLGNGQVDGRVNNASVLMEDFTWSGFTGTINTYQPGDGSCVTDPCWYNAGLPKNLTHTQAVIMECNTNSSCKGFQTKNIQVIPQAMTPATVICMNATAALNPKLGFVCKNGTFTPT